MSIVVLKRKSIRYQAKISGKGSKGFSINGGLRNQGWVGQTTLGRHLSKTPFRGNLPMGNGGCCGNYDVSILSGSNCCTNDPNIIKRSTMNTSPYILASVEHPTPVFIPNCTKGCFKNTDKSFIDFTPFIHSQGNYIKHKHNVHNREELCCPPTKSDEDKSKVCPCPDVSKDVNIQSSNEYTERGVLHKNGLPTHIHHHHAITKSSTVLAPKLAPLQCMHLTLTQSFITALATYPLDGQHTYHSVFGGKYCRSYEFYVASHDDVQIWQQVEDPEVYYLEWLTLKLLIKGDVILIQNILGVGPASLPTPPLGPGGVVVGVPGNEFSIMWSDTGPIYCGQDTVSVNFPGGGLCLTGRAPNTTTVTIPA